MNLWMSNTSFHGNYIVHTMSLWKFLCCKIDFWQLIGRGVKSWVNGGGGNGYILLYLDMHRVRSKMGMEGGKRLSGWALWFLNICRHYSLLSLIIIKYNKFFYVLTDLWTWIDCNSTNLYNLQFYNNVIS